MSRRLTTKQTRPPHDVWHKTSDLRRLENVELKSSWRRTISRVLKTPHLRRLEDVMFTTSWRRLIYDVLKTSNFQRLEDVGFTSSWRRLICNVLRTFVLWRLLDVCRTMSVLKRCPINVERNDFLLFSTVWNIQKISRASV